MNLALRNNLITVPNGLIGYWRMDAADIFGTTIADISNNGNIGNLSSLSGANLSQGRVGTSLKFDGSSSVVLVSNTTPLSSLPLSYCAWINLSASPPSGQTYIAGIIAKNNTNPGPTLRIGIASSGTALYPNFAGSSTYITNSASISLNKWYHFCGTLTSASGGTGILYQNGVNIASGGSLGTGVSTYALRIGSDASGRFLNGYIDEARVYNRALSPSEVMEIYTAGLAGHQ